MTVWLWSIRPYYLSIVWYFNVSFTLNAWSMLSLRMSLPLPSTYFWYNKTGNYHLICHANQCCQNWRKFSKPLLSLHQSTLMSGKNLPLRADFLYPTNLPTYIKFNIETSSFEFHAILSISLRVIIPFIWRYQ